MNRLGADQAAAAGRLKLALYATLAIFVLPALAASMLPIDHGGMSPLNGWLLLHHDLGLFGAQIAIAATALFASRTLFERLRLARWQVAFIALAIVASCYAGHLLILGGYDLVRDEQMATFDAWIFRHGRLAWPIAPNWQPYADALNTTFMLPVKQPQAWVSTYLPGNALLHALVGLVADPALTAPLLAGVSLILVWSCARKIWPEDPQVAAVAVILLALSGQVLFTAMTTWAMTAHLCANLLWLRLLLNDRRSSDAAALGVGAFATGLHQPLFHPLFAAPFLLDMLVQRRFARLALFAAAYLAIGLFWLQWPHFLHRAVAGPHSVDLNAATDYVTRLRDTLATNKAAVPIMAANLFRFLAWQHLALVPLMFCAWPAIRRDRIAPALALCVVLPIVAMTILLPWQGYGFGYRYLHPALGAAVLLAAYGWRELAPLHERLRSALIIASVGQALLILPYQGHLAHAFAAPNVAADRAIDASGADYALFDLDDGPGYANIVHNRPDLSNRPVRLVADQVPDHAALARMICRSGARLALPANSFFRPGAEAVNLKSPDTADATAARLRVPYEAAGCSIIVLR